MLCFTYALLNLLYLYNRYLDIYNIYNRYLYLCILDY